MTETKIDTNQPPAESVAPVSTKGTPIAHPTPEGEKFDHLAKREQGAESRQEALLDEAIEESFPASDPISPKHMT